MERAELLARALDFLVRMTDEDVPHHAIGQLALEAGLRDRRIGEFIGELVSGTIQKNLLHRVLDIS